MKRILPILTIFIIISFGLVYFFNKNNKITEVVPPSISPTNSPIPSETNTSSSNCLSSDFQATLSLDYGAGNVYGKLILKNVSDKVCQVIGNNFIVPTYDTQTLKNISTEHQGKPEKDIFTLNPNQELYSQIHYPNGPQCSDKTNTAKVQFTYAISSSVNITFVDTQNNKDQNIQVCSSPTEITTIKVWNISSTPITP